MKKRVNTAFYAMPQSNGAVTTARETRRVFAVFTSFSLKCLCFCLKSPTGVAGRCSPGAANAVPRHVFILLRNRKAEKPPESGRIYRFSRVFPLECVQPFLCPCSCVLLFQPLHLPLIKTFMSVVDRKNGVDESSVAFLTVFHFDLRMRTTMLLSR